MSSTLEYASLSAFVYNDQRGGGIPDAETSRLDVPSGWTVLLPIHGCQGNAINSNPASFTAGAYINQSTGEIVIAYKSTDLLSALPFGVAANVRRKQAVGGRKLAKFCQLV